MQSLVFLKVIIGKEDLYLVFSAALLFVVQDRHANESRKPS